MYEKEKREPYFSEPPFSELQIQFAVFYFRVPETMDI